MVIIPRRFEFDPAKSAANKAKHGIDFEESQAIWDDSDRIEVIGRLVGEPRFLVIGRIGRRVWAACITYRHEAIRIISVRPARQNEREVYVDGQADHR